MKERRLLLLFVLSAQGAGREINMKQNNYQNEDIPMLGDWRYEIDWYCKDENNKPVCTFIPEVMSMIKVVSTTGDKDLVRLKIHFKEGESKENIVSLSELDRMDWFTIDKRCIINPHYKNANGYISNIIRASLNDVPIETRYSPDKLGICHIGDEVAFIAGDRAIARSSATQLESSFNLDHLSFRLDIDTGLTKKQTFEGMKELISLSPEIGRVLVAHVISGLTREAFKEAGFIPCAVLVIVGESGMLKSQYVPQIVQLYNRSDEIRADTRFNSTQRYIEDILYEHSECTTVIDDLHTAEARYIKRTNEATAEEIIRRVSDDTGRGHKEGKVMVQRKFRGNVVFIGEYAIGRESTMPRALIVNLTKRPDGKILDKYQRKQPLLVSTFYYYFIQWYVEHYADICDWIDMRLTNFRTMSTNLHIHGRLKDTQFYLHASYIIFLEFCKDSGFILSEDVQDESSIFEKQLFQLVQDQQKRYKSNATTVEDVDYLKFLQKLYKESGFRLADSADTFRVGKHDGLIYYGCLCLRRENLEKVIHKRFPYVQINDVIESLVARRALKQGKSKRTVKISTLNKEVGAIRFYAIWLYALDCK